MEIYVQSRGKAQDLDYKWLKVDSNDQFRENPPIPEDTRRLVQSQSTSLALVRSDGRLILWIAGLESSDRIDFSRTKVRNAIVWVVSDSNTEEENLLRGIAARFLEGQYGETIDKAVRFSDNGFQVNFADIERIGKREKVQAGLPNSILKIGTNNQANLTQLANELRVASLPKNIVNLVIVTGMQSKENLIAARVWRGLSKQIENLSLEVYTPPNPVDPDIIKATLEKAQNDTKLITDLLRSKLGLGLLFFFLLLAAYYFSLLSKLTITTNPPVDTPTPTSVATLAPTTATPIVTPPPTTTPEVPVTNTIAPTPTQTSSILPSPSPSSKPTQSSSSIPIMPREKIYSYTITQGDSVSMVLEKCVIDQNVPVKIWDKTGKNDITNTINKDKVDVGHIIKFPAPSTYKKPPECNAIPDK